MHSYIYTVAAMVIVLSNSCESNKANQISHSTVLATSTEKNQQQLKHGAYVTDYDGNTYHAIIIGNQIWMAGNLKVTHYNNGDQIPMVTGDKAWRQQVIGAYCNYNNDTSSVDTYGRLYDWHATIDTHKLAPKGWHIPTEEECYD